MTKAKDNFVPFLPQKQIDYAHVERILSNSLDANHFTNNGPVKKRLELYLEGLLGIDKSKRVVCCSNGTAALHSIIFKGNGRWVTPAFTFPSCVVGHDTTMCVEDIDPSTYTLPLDNKMVRKYDAVVLTNLFGSYVNLDAWTDFCKQRGAILVLDNAASPLSTYNGVNICNFGDYSFGSLHHTKYLGFGEGGFIVCPEKEYEEFNSITNFGFHYGSSEPRQYNPRSSNFKMSDVSAAFILSHMDNYDIAQHIENQYKIIDGISKMSHVEPFNYKSGTVYNTFPVLFNKAASESYFIKLGIKAHKYYKPLSSLPHSDALYNRIINFPLYASLSEEQIDYIVESIGECK